MAATLIVHPQHHGDDRFVVIGILAFGMGIQNAAVRKWGVPDLATNVKSGGRGDLHPPAPTDPDVTVSRYPAPLTRRSVSTSGPTSTGRTGQAVFRSARPTTA